MIVMISLHLLSTLQPPLSSFPRNFFPTDMKSQSLLFSLVYSTSLITLLTLPNHFVLSSLSQTLLFLKKLSITSLSIKSKPSFTSHSFKPINNHSKMARTKGNHTDFSLSPSPSPERSPSPPPLPSPLNPNPNSDPFFCSPPKSHTTSAPLKTYARIIRPRKAKSSEAL